MNKHEVEQVERVQEQIVALSPGQIEVLKAWVNASYDDNGNWRRTQPQFELTILAFQDQVDVMEEQVVSRFGRDTEQHQVIKDLRGLMDKAAQIARVRNDLPGPNPPLTAKQAEWYWELIKAQKEWQPRFDWLMQEMNKPQND